MKPGQKKNVWFRTKTGLLDNFYAKAPPLTMILINVIYNLQYNIVYNLENHNLLSISSEEFE